MNMICICEVFFMNLQLISNILAKLHKLCNIHIFFLKNFEGKKFTFETGLNILFLKFRNYDLAINEDFHS